LKWKAYIRALPGLASSDIYHPRDNLLLFNLLATRGCPANLYLRCNNGPRPARHASPSHTHLSTLSRRRFQPEFPNQFRKFRGSRGVFNCLCAAQSAAYLLNRYLLHYSTTSLICSDLLYLPDYTFDKYFVNAPFISLCSCANQSVMPCISSSMASYSKSCGLCPSPAK
jgi:hypothetical protein